jgi:hypothetical protein
MKDEARLLFAISGFGDAIVSTAALASKAKVVNLMTGKRTSSSLTMMIGKKRVDVSEEARDGGVAALTL